jgi:beta-phosphoglucomutase-like phosphatase (HAD superfamily)
MDGLLVDSERLVRRVWQETARHRGVELPDAQFASFVGHSADVCNRLLGEYFGADFDIPAFHAACDLHLRTVVDAEGVALRAGAREWLAFVRELGIPLGLATACGPVAVRERLGELLAGFDAVVTRADVERGKPFPDLYLEAAARLGVAPGDALALEDSPTGARAAIAAGMPVLVVPDLVDTPPEIVALAVGVYDSLDAVREAAARAWADALAPAERGVTARGDVER